MRFIGQFAIDPLLFARTEQRGFATRIFISVQFRRTQTQDTFLAEAQSFLRAVGAEPVLHPPTPPNESADLLSIIREAILQCSGTLIIAFERFHYSGGAEIVGPASATECGPRSTATVWNHIEATIALQARQPILIMKERVLAPEGLLDPAVATGPIVEFDLREDALGFRTVQPALEAWLRMIG